MLEIDIRDLAFDQRDNVLGGNAEHCLGGNEVPCELIIIGRKGNKEVFILTKTERGVDGVVYWQYTSASESIGTKFRIYNC